jgi:hypothetical protein
MRPEPARAPGRDNLRTPLSRRRTAPGGMADFDRLPAPLRCWLHGAVLPWSPASARRVWVRALAEAGGCESAALAALDRAEARRLAGEGAARTAFRALRGGAIRGRTALPRERTGEALPLPAAQDARPPPDYLHDKDGGRGALKGRMASRAEAR